MAKKKQKPSDPSQDASYVVLSPVDYDNVRYEIDDEISPPEDVAAPLLERGAIACIAKDEADKT